MLLKIIGIILFFSMHHYNSNYSTLTCGTTCSPSTCSFVNNTVCTSLPTVSTNMQTLLNSVPCKQCTQSTDARCTKVALTSTWIGPGIQAAYCNANFLVVWSLGTPNHPDGLKQIPKPPGADNCLMRSYATQSQTYRIPLNYTLLTSGNTNTMPGWPGYQIPLAGPVGVAVNGVPIFPSIDASGLTGWEACELDNCNAHAGKGADYHYHGDPSGTSCLYTDSNSTNNHPPLIGYSLDGLSIYGRYFTASADGQTTELDNCGGHTHGTYGYHYHQSVDTTTKSFPLFWAGPKLCWAADISKIANFWQSNNQQVYYDNSKSNPAYSISSRGDYEDLKPCCGSTSYLLNNGNSINTVAGATGGTTGGSLITKTTNSTFLSLTLSLFIFIIATLLYC